LRDCAKKNAQPHIRYLPPDRAGIHFSLVSSETEINPQWGRLVALCEARQDLRKEKYEKNWWHMAKNA